MVDGTPISFRWLRSNSMSWPRRYGRLLTMCGPLVVMILIILGYCSLQPLSSAKILEISSAEIPRQAKIDRIPDVEKWQEITLNGSKILLDPRLTLDDLAKINWEEPVEVPISEDPLGIFREKMIPQDDENLINHIRRNVLIEPATEQYQLANPEVRDFSEHNGTSQIVFPMLEKQKVPLSYYIQTGATSKTRTFFEAGALDGEKASRSLYLEREHGWTGLAVEMTYPNARRFLTKNRKCWFAPVCLAPGPVPVRKHMRFGYNPKDPWTERTGTINKRKWDLLDAPFTKYRRYVYTVVDCYPLYSLLLAANMTDVQFLSLDLEGVELQVLRSVPWSKVDIPVISIEVFHTEEGSEAVTSFLESLGYLLHNPRLVEQHVENRAGYFYDSRIYLKQAIANKL